MELNQIKEKRVFTAVDLSEHETITDAKLHNGGLKLREVLIERGIVADGQVKKICLLMATHYDTFKPTFDFIRNQHSQKKAKKTMAKQAA